MPKASIFCGGFIVERVDQRVAQYDICRVRYGMLTFNHVRQDTNEEKN